MPDRVATIKGTFLVPAVSKNRRLYTRENIKSAVVDMQKRIASEDGPPLTMFGSHNKAGEGNVLDTIGRITKVEQQSDGSATFEADIANTTAGRDMAALIDPKNPFVRGISIRGAWTTEPHAVEADDGKPAITADALALDGIDWTHRPGMENAQITDAEFYESAPIEMSENFVFESADVEAVFFDETEEVEDQPLELSVNEQAASKLQEAAELLLGADEADKAPYGDVTYADPGYQKDKQKRYPINTAAHVRAAWSYINQAKNQESYSSAQVARIKSRIKSAAKKFNINITEELETLKADIQELLEAYACMSIDNGGGSVSVSGYTDDAGKLAPMARRIAMSAIIGLNAMDPDADGDIDLQMPDGSSDSTSSQEDVDNNDDNMSPDLPTCAECGAAVPENSLFCPQCASPIVNAESSEEEEEVTDIQEDGETADETSEQEPIVANEETTQEATETETNESVETAPAAISFSPEQFSALLEALKPAPVVATTEEEVVDEGPKTYTQEEIDAIKRRRKAGG